MNRNITMGVAVLVVILAVGGALYYRSLSSSNNNNNSATPQNIEDMSPTSSASDSSQTGVVKEITVTGSNYKFEPANLTVNKGDTVKVIFKNSGGMHDFVIDEFNAKSKIIPDGQEATVEFVADKSGTFKYYCSVGNHRSMGMEGTLVVQ